MDVLKQRRQMVQISQALLTLVSGSSKVSRVWGKCSRRGTPGRPWAPSIGMATLMLALTACGPGEVDLRGWGQTGKAAVETATYVVQAGDTLGGIAADYGTTVETLIRMNAAAYPRLAESQGRVIVAGWTLVVPASRPAAHTIRPAAELAPAIDRMASGPAAEGYFDEEAALEIVQLTNEARARSGLPALTIDTGLMEIAQQRATALVNNFSHDGLENLCNCGENAARLNAKASARAFVDGWMAGEGHRRNLLRPDYRVMGVAVYRMEISNEATPQTDESCYDRQRRTCRSRRSQGTTPQDGKSHGLSTARHLAPDPSGLGILCYPPFA